jgi:hypothetical protein
VVTIRIIFIAIQYSLLKAIAADLTLIKLLINGCKSVCLSTAGMYYHLSKLAIEVEFVMGDNNNASFAIAVTGAIEKNS